MTDTTLPRLQLADLARRSRATVAPRILEEASGIVENVRSNGEPALRSYARRFGERGPAQPLVLDRAALARAWEATSAEDRALLERTAARIASFARAQRETLQDLDLPFSGGAMGHTVRPVEAAGCYAPGGRFPLPSSVLMTAVTAQVAGVKQVWVASPNPATVTLAAAHVAGADGLLACGGAHAIAALAYGIGGVPRCDVVVGPGNAWVTAAKRWIAGEVRIDILAGPSELLVVADETADPRLVAADLLAQAEHDELAVPMLVASNPRVIEAVERELADQLATLPTAPTARAALANGCAVVAATEDAMVEACEALAPEHLQLMTARDRSIASRLTRYGALFIGAGAAEVFGDYGAGPNHVLPTGDAARANGGLSVLAFLKVNTWLRIEAGTPAGELARDAAAMARLEGLHGHARAAELRLEALRPA